MKFTKMQGLGNDYVYLDCMDGLPEGLPALARRLSDRHFGVGSDGLICICPSRTADFRMRMFNADGSEGEMCGNGIRCLGKFVYDKGLTDRRTLTVETLAGPRTLTLSLSGPEGKVSAVTVDMGVPEVGPRQSLTVDGRGYAGIPVSVGNPHFVVPVDDPAALDLPKIGPIFEHFSYFPNRTNTEFVRVTAPGVLALRVWERGSGETLACGTGACAAVAAMASAGLLPRQAQVRLLGGDLQVCWDGESGRLLMTGPAVTVFEGELPPD